MSEIAQFPAGLSDGPLARFDSPPPPAQAPDKPQEPPAADEEEVAWLRARRGRDPSPVPRAPVKARLAERLMPTASQGDRCPVAAT